MVSINCLSQLTPNTTVTTIVKDFNNDNIADSIIRYSIESNGEYLKVYNSLSNEYYEIGGRGSYNYSKACFLEIIPLPENLMKPESKPLLDTIINCLLPNFKKLTLLWTG